MFLPLRGRKSNMITDIKYFTPGEAKRTLPLVRQIVKDILTTTREMRLLAEDLGGEDIEKNPSIIKMAEQVQGFMQELEELGCYYRDWNFNIGLVDFPAIFDSKEVLLCWRSDEEDILYYHGTEDGYAGRKLIPEQYK
jgi:hypothetical protein